MWSVYGLQLWQLLSHVTCRGCAGQILFARNPLQLSEWVQLRCCC
uniref:Uncharacterized protein n=1 Tax=Anguilla anguilla TaxID=7936 RepID=A0A0E9XBY8_ANGAN